MTTRITAACLIAALVVAPAFAAGKKNKDRKDPTAAIKKKLDAADLPTDVREKANKVVQDDSAKLKDAQSKIDSIITAEQKQARKTAQKDAKTSGKKRKEAQASVTAAMKLTDEQKTKLSAAESELKSAQAGLISDLRGVMTSEQFAKVGLKTKKKKA